MATNYPTHIDDTSSLPVVSDNVNRVSADVINRLRAAIIAVESELGVKPSAIYGTVTNRLDGIDSLINSIIGSVFTAAGDLSGNLTSQIVIGLQGNPINAGTPNLNDVLTWNGSAWAGAVGAGGAAGGSDTYVQFNDGSAFGGDAGLTYNKTTNVLSLSDAIAFGATPATSGNIRLSNATTITYRDSADANDLTLSELDSSDILYLGTDSAFTGAKQVSGMNIYTNSGGILYMGNGSLTRLRLDSGGVTLYNLGDPLTFGYTGAATVGDIRLPYSSDVNHVVMANKGSDASDRSLIISGLDSTTFGDSAGQTNINGSQVSILVGGNAQFTASGSLNTSTKALAVGPDPATTGDCLRLGPSTANAGVYNDIVTTRINGADAAIVRIHDGASFLMFSDPNYYTTIRGYSNTYTADVAGAHEFIVGVTSMLLVDSATTTIGTINTIQSGNANGSVKDVIRSLHTADATITDIYTWTIQTGAVTTVDALITAISDDGTVGGSYKRTVTFRENAGVNLIGTLHDNQTDEDAAGWDVTIDHDGAGGGRIRVTGDAVLGVTWYVSGRVQHVILTP